MRVGIVGSGLRGQMYGQALSRVSDVEVAGMCDLSDRARASAAERFVGPVLSSHQELYALGLDAVVIATPDFAHLTPALDAANAGLHLMIEKPLATTSAEAQQIVDAVNTNVVSCLVAFENRWNPHFLKVRALIDSGELGDIVSVSAVLSNTYFVPESMLSWSAKSSPGWFLMPHTLDLAMWLADSAPASATARGHKGILAARGIDTWDSVDALVELESGAVVNLRSSWILPTSSPHIVDFRLEVIGTKGSARIDMSDQGLHTSTDRFASHWALSAQVDGIGQGMAEWMVQSWARHLVAGDPVGPGAEHGAVITKTIEDIHNALD
ncbi:Gfo/Idh/MocA family protein [Glaciibacter superstes]|uniref:Gfo/Idh/MocA family protein n=1 Tax=Glaciibacter superstes TaxID=501023 RepID=UPI0003B4B896|nr:Gfo/Idh/MocA family oxidoreductase [Glaciibacter superstes]